MSLIIDLSKAITRKQAKEVHSKKPLPEGGVWRTIRGSHVYILNGKIIAGAIHGAKAGTAKKMTKDQMKEHQATIDKENKKKAPAKKPATKKAPAKAPIKKKTASEGAKASITAKQKEKEKILAEEKKKATKIREEQAKRTKKAVEKLVKQPKAKPSVTPEQAKKDAKRALDATLKAPKEKKAQPTGEGKSWLDEQHQQDIANGHTPKYTDVPKERFYPRIGQGFTKSTVHGIPVTLTHGADAFVHVEDKSKSSLSSKSYSATVYLAKTGHYLSVAYHNGEPSEEEKNEMIAEAVKKANDRIDLSFRDKDHFDSKLKEMVDKGELSPRYNADGTVKPEMTKVSKPKVKKEYEYHVRNGGKVYRLNHNETPEYTKHTTTDKPIELPNGDNLYLHKQDDGRYAFIHDKTGVAFMTSGDKPSKEKFRKQVEDKIASHGHERINNLLQNTVDKIGTVADNLKKSEEPKKDEAPAEISYSKDEVYEIYHGTKRANLEGILKNGFLLSYGEELSDDFGRAVYFKSPAFDHIDREDPYYDNSTTQDVVSSFAGGDYNSSVKRRDWHKDKTNIIKAIVPKSKMLDCSESRPFELATMIREIEVHNGVKFDNLASESNVIKKKYAILKHTVGVPDEIMSEQDVNNHYDKHAEDIRKKYDTTNPRYLSPYQIYAKNKGYIGVIDKLSNYKDEGVQIGIYDPKAIKIVEHGWGMDETEEGIKLRKALSDLMKAVSKKKDYPYCLMHHRITDKHVELHIGVS